MANWVALIGVSSCSIELEAERNQSGDLSRYPKPKWEIRKYYKIKFLPSTFPHRTYSFS